jgi:hypothetical protein
MSSSDECCKAMANFVGNELKNKEFRSFILATDMNAGVNRNNLSIFFQKGERGAVLNKHPLLGIDTQYSDIPIPTIVLLASGLSESNIDDFINRYDKYSKKGGAKRTRKNRKVRSRS